MKYMRPDENCQQFSEFANKIMLEIAHTHTTACFDVNSYSKISYTSQTERYYIYSIIIKIILDQLFRSNAFIEGKQDQRLKPFIQLELERKLFIYASKNGLKDEICSVRLYTFDIINITAFRPQKVPIHGAKIFQNFPILTIQEYYFSHLWLTVNLKK